MNVATSSWSHLAACASIRVYNTDRGSGLLLPLDSMSLGLFYINGGLLIVLWYRRVTVI